MAWTRLFAVLDRIMEPTHKPGMAPRVGDRIGQMLFILFAIGVLVAIGVSVARPTEKPSSIQSDSCIVVSGPHYNPADNRLQYGPCDEAPESPRVCGRFSAAAYLQGARVTFVQCDDQGTPLP